MHNTIDSLVEDTIEDDSWESLVWQELQQTTARRLNVDVANVKPCFARMEPVPEGNRNNTAYELSTELRRMGVAEATAWGDLRRWNRLCRPPLPERELRAAFQSAWRSEKTYGCRGLLAATWCIGREKCDWYRQNVAGRRKCRETDFFDLGWPLVLKSSEFRVYMALVRIEQREKVGPSGLVIASTRDYAENSGVYRGRVMGALEQLESHGLLAVMERGQKRMKGLPGRACQVRRVVPIPEPPVKTANERRSALCA